MVFLIRGPAYLPMPLIGLGFALMAAGAGTGSAPTNAVPGRDLVVVEARGSTGVAGGRGTQSD